MELRCVQCLPLGIWASVESSPALVLALLPICAAIHVFPWGVLTLAPHGCCNAHNDTHFASAIAFKKSVKGTEVVLSDYRSSESGETMSFILIPCSCIRRSLLGVWKFCVFFEKKN
jgi:hypothetical protein